MPYLVAVPVLSGADAELLLVADVLEAEAEAKATPVDDTDPLDAIKPVLVALFVEGVTEVVVAAATAGEAVLCGAALALVLVALPLPLPLSKLWPSTTVAERNLTSSFDRVAVMGFPFVSSFPPFWATVHVIWMDFLL